MKTYITILIVLFTGSGAMAQWFPQNSRLGVNLNSVMFPSPNTGYAVGDLGTILKTEDGGNNWMPQNSGNAPNLTSVWFTGSDTGYAVGLFGIILKTTDGGSNWIQEEGPVSSGPFFNSVFFPAPGEGFTAGFSSDYYNNAWGTVWKTTDGFTSFTAQAQVEGVTFHSVHFPNPDTGCVVGDYGTILVTQNGGSDWTTLPQANGSPGLFSVFFPTGSMGIAVGGSGTILKTTDAGMTWTAVNSGSLETLYSVYFPDPLTGYAVGSKGVILKTTDGGDSWFQQTSGIIETLRSVYFTSSNSGFVVGDQGTILATTDGGGYPTGISDMSRASGTLTVYPNPASDKIFVNTNRNDQVRILDMNGRQLWQQTSDGAVMSIDVSSFPPGVYFVRSVGSSELRTGKFVRE